MNFSQVKKIPPSFAGVLVEWKIGSKEITATIIDLVVHDFLGTSGNIVFLTGKKTGLKPFEEQFMQKLFGETKSLVFEEIAETAYKKYSGELLKIICHGMITKGLIYKDFQKKFAQGINQALTETFGQQAQLKIPKNTKPIIIPPWIFRLFIGLFGLKGLYNYFEKKIFQKMGGSREEVMLTENGKNQKQEVLLLKNFMDKFPMVEDRLANELASYSIAFGIGKQWMKKLGGRTALAKELLEKLEGHDDTTARFIDIDSYLKEFQ